MCAKVSLSVSNGGVSVEELWLEVSCWWSVVMEGVLVEYNDGDFVLARC